MLRDNYITGSCSINNGVVRKGKRVVFSDSSSALSELLVAIYKNLNLSYPKFYKMDNLSKLGWLAVEILLQDTSVKEDYKPEEIGLIFANANSSLDNDLKFHHADIDVRSPSVFVYTLPNIVIGEISIRNNFKGEHSFFIQDKFDMDFIYKQVNYMLNQYILEACICGWVEVLGEDYKVVLYLIEKSDKGKGLLFSPKNMNKIFNEEQIEHR